MPWYKAWHESKSRFAYTLAGMLLVSGLFVLSFEAWNLNPARVNFRGFVWHALYFRFFHAAWVFSTLFLAVGGLLAERHEGTALFSLSLPVRRWRMLLARAAVGAGEAVVTAVIPAMSIPLFALLIGRRYPAIQSLEFATLLVGGGMVFFCLGILLSTLLRGDWAPLAVGIPIVAGIYAGTRSSAALRAYNPQDLFSGAVSVRAPAWTLGGSLPWSAVVVSIAVALILLLISILITEKMEF